MKLLSWSSTMGCLSSVKLILAVSPWLAGPTTGRQNWTGAATAATARLTYSTRYSTGRAEMVKSTDRDV